METSKRSIDESESQLKVSKLTIVACYAPTEEAEEEEKDEFYEQLEEEIRTTPRHDVLMVIGDLNARVGEDNTGKERAMGTQGFGCANNNGERLSDLCLESRLVIGGTLFMHRDIHKTTWRSPDQRTVSQIDHTCYYKPEMEEVTTGCQS